MSVTSTTYSYNYYLRSAYAKNRNALNDDYRNTQSKATIMQADSSAVKSISEKLRNIEYSSDHGTEILRSAKVLVTAYNNLMDSSDDSNDSTISNLKKQLGKLTKSEKDNLASIGIEISSNGKLKLDEETFADSSPSKIKRILSSDSTFTSSVQKYAKKIYRASGKLQTYTKTASKTTQGISQAGLFIDENS